ncbi:hypothetical protein ND748_01010 [Frankia sp. AiPs1]|uniref:hypothetical protein n=1 Tax=Frankia sp. AiPs1 TaxID=573493 RepID=UPI002043266D|nr:hypothetical protein [Frankia sp. AiPs1]MCM3920269.1 hypothetical protein [Frankia sp. AiPs1]
MIVMKAPPDRLPLWLLPHLYRSYVSGAKSNICIDACQTLAAAFRQLGIRARLWPVELTITPPGRILPARYGANPRWNGNVFHGHCVLWLPDHQHFIDVTLEQFAETAHDDPLVGRALVPPGAPDWAASGGESLVPRSDGTLLHYRAGTADQATAMMDAAVVRNLVAAHHRAGTNLASTAVAMCGADPEILARARSGPFPRFRALLDALQGVPFEVDEAEDWRFSWPAPDGSRRPLRLDEIPVSVPPTAGP